MKSTFGGLVDAFRGARDAATNPPVPYTGRRGSIGVLMPMRNDREAQQAAMGANGTLFGIVHKTSTAQAALTWRLYRKAKSGQKEDRTEITSHAFLDLWNKPNDFYSGYEFREAIQQHMDLVGEWWILVQRSAVARGIILGLWPIRPDRMYPVPSVDKFIAGYMYVSPDGEKIPLGIDEVIQTKMPNPLDPYRGMGPVQSILTQIDSVKYSAEWNRNFFLNSAEPGGIIEVDKRLSDDEFDEMTKRWREQHQGISAAHRVAVIEQGKWVDRKYTNRDMQFAELRTLSRDEIMEAYGFPKTMLGIAVDVNRANAETGKEIFDENLTIPRADRMRDMLNTRLLPLVDPAGVKGIEVDYDDPKGDNQEQANAERQSKTEAWSALVLAGADPEEAADVVGLPRMKWVGIPAAGAGPTGVTPEPIAQPAPEPSTEETAPESGAGSVPLAAPEPENAWRRLNVAPRPRNEITKPEDVDLTAVQEEWQSALDALNTHWGAIVLTAWYADLTTQVRRAVDDGDIAALTQLTLDTDAARTDLLRAMENLASSAGALVRREAEAQGVDDVEPTDPPRGELDDVATVTTGILAAGAVLSAASAALTAYGPGVAAHAVADAVAAHLAALTDAQPRMQLGRALTAAQNSGRLATILAGPEAAVYASEVNDSHTCPPCRAIDGKWLGNANDEGVSRSVRDAYPSSGYVGCQGGPRCRGTIVAIWRK